MSLARLHLVCASMTLASLLHAQGEAWVGCERKELEVAMDRYEQLMVERTSWKLEMAMLSYGDAGGPVADRSTSIVMRDGAFVKADQLGLVTYQNDRICAVADPEERTVVLSDGRPVMELLTHQRLDVLLMGSTRLSRQVNALGTLFRVQFDPKISAYSHIDVGYDARGFLTKVELQWHPTLLNEPSSPLAPVRTPRVELTIAPPVELSALDRAQLRKGLSERLRQDGTGYVPIGPWAGYRIVDTRYMP